MVKSFHATLYAGLAVLALGHLGMREYAECAIHFGLAISILLERRESGCTRQAKVRISSQLNYPFDDIQ